VLLAGGNARIIEKLKQYLESRGHEVETSDGSRHCVARFEAAGAELVIACLPLRQGRGRELIGELCRIDPRVSVIVTGSDAQLSGGADALALGAHEYVEDAARHFDQVLAAAGTVLGSRRGDVQLRWLKQRDAQSSDWSAVCGESAEMRQVIDLVRRVCERTTNGSPPTILILGETGTGKGLLAKCIHYNGVRRNRAFVDINCAAIPATLLESELFGHERGAFTDAKSSRPGLFETAEQGTLFLDEIGSIPIDLQAKLLVAIEDKRVRRVGGRSSVTLDVQIVAASHNDLREKVRRGEFREDLFHRLNVVSITLPPLRKRGHDKLILARKFVDSMAREYGVPVPALSADAEQYILDYTWPGNVRELKNRIERILLLGSGEVIGREHFEGGSIPPPPTSNRSAFALPDEGIGLDEVERQLIQAALQRFEGNVSRAARFLKVTRQTLIYRIKKHRLS
jgi:DNA-binding NtrC family response regulator